MNADKQPHLRTTNDEKDRINKLAYRDGSIHYDDWETELPVGNTSVQKSNLAVRGLLFGITIAVLLGLISGTLLLFAHQYKPSSPSKSDTSFSHTLQP
ncbi:MAG TPA: hypothetical protein V6C95_17220 [Coleofasciculaceae cyanobacterium]